MACLLALLQSIPLAARASHHGVPCNDFSLGTVASRTHDRFNACVTQPKRLLLETTYYQNASKDGGTALAAFPEARIRYGVTSHVEAFVDAPSEIAKSGQSGAGIYVMTHMGTGAKWEFARAHGIAYTLVAESHPPLNALANLYVVPNSEEFVTANWEARRATMGFEVGQLNFSGRRGHRDALTSAWSYSTPIDSLTSITTELGMQSVTLRGASAQYSGRVAFGRQLTPRLLFDLELGTAFNASGNSKPHYLGAGFAIR
jgi:hypothetical protein